MSFLSDARAGVAAISPMLVGVVPFGLVVGATPVAKGFGRWAGVGLSTLVFAGASQLAIVDVLSQGGSALVAVLAACTINLRMVLYSASLAPYFAHESLGRRIGVAALLNDQTYAISVARWAEPRNDPAGRFAFYVGAGALLWLAWQLATVAGVLVGGAVPGWLPIDFAVPLVFLVLLVPLVRSRPALASALVGAVATVAAAEAGAADFSLVVGALSGVAAGTVVDLTGPRPAEPAGGSAA